MSAPHLCADVRGNCPPFLLLILLGLGCFSRERSPEGGAPAAPPSIERPAPPPEAEPAPAGSAQPEAPRPPASAADQAPASGGASKRTPVRSAAPKAKDEAAESGRSLESELPEEEVKPSRRERRGSLPESLMEQLSNEVSLGAPDCPSARERKKTICDLAGQICRLVDRDPNVASVGRYCSDAKQRCSEAEDRTVERCGR